jgi:hypothetical protein
LAWRGPAAGENDIWALIAILGVSAVITVPLLNWSKSLRELRLDKSSKDNKDEFSKVRTTIIYWGFLVTVGLLSVLVLVYRSLNEVFLFTNSNMLFNEATISCFIHSFPMNYSSLEFLSPSVNLPISKRNVSVPVADADWAELYGCSNPCRYVTNPAISRLVGDYQLPTLKQLKVILRPDLMTSQERTASSFESFVAQWSYFVFPYVVLQGFWTASFGRRSPAQIRNALYILLRDGKIPRNGQPRINTNVHFHRRMFAKFAALTAYAWALFVTVICLPVMVVSVVAAELWIRNIPEGEAPNHVGAWSAWAGLALVLIAALIAQLQQPFSETFHRVRRESSWAVIWRNLSSGVGSHFKNFSWPILTFLITTPKAEWISLRAFWNDADTAEYYNRHGKKVAPPLGYSVIQNLRASTLPEMGSIVPRKSWWNSKFEKDNQQMMTKAVPRSSLDAASATNLRGTNEARKPSPDV